MNAKSGRSYEKKFEVAAPVEAVWQAITEGEELTRWFCLEAQCEPGVGGTRVVDWGGGAKGTSVVTIWEPNAHLRTESLRPDLTRPEGSEPYAIDWYLEHDGGVTRVRMVASGFGEGPGWDHEYDGTFHGWDMFHRTMKHYLEHHRGCASANVVIYVTVDVPPTEAWARLTGPDGLVHEGSLEDLTVGAPFRFVTPDGDVFAGVVRGFVPGKTFSALVESLNLSFFNIEMASMPGHGNFVYFSLATWGLPPAEVDALGERLRKVFHGLFPQPEAGPKSACGVES